jgi:hypothetical protein
MPPGTWTQHKKGGATTMKKTKICPVIDYSDGRATITLPADKMFEFLEQERRENEEYKKHPERFGVAMPVK